MTSKLHQIYWVKISNVTRRTKNGLTADCYAIAYRLIGVDISYIWTKEGWLYLAIVIDLFSRKIVGWHTSSRLKQDLAIKALEKAITMRNPPEGLIHHSDRGSQYCSHDYLKLLTKNKMKASMSATGNCYPSR